MKKLLSIILTVVMVMALGVPVFAADPEVISAVTGSATNDIEVGYTYTSGTDTAAKHFYVTLAFTLPTTLEYDGGVAAYKWNPEAGKYEADTDNDEAGSGTLTDDGAFSIVITNQSNVGITYTVEYTTDANAIFATAAADDWENAEGTVDTVAKGQQIGDTGITITNVTEATTGDTSFKSATCTGSITVTGINEGKTPTTASGSDTLGTFKVTIGEGEAEEEEEEETDPLVLGNIVIEGMNCYIRKGYDFSQLEEYVEPEQLMDFQVMLEHGDLEMLEMELQGKTGGAVSVNDLIKTEAKNVGDEIPTDTSEGVVVVEYGDYTYTLGEEGWGVKVLDKSKSSYGDIMNSIAGVPIVSLESAFFMCSNMVVAPALPQTVRDYTYAFDFCDSLTTISSPIYVDGAEIGSMFRYDDHLSGEVELIGTPSWYGNAFYNAGSADGVYLTGTCDPAVLADLAAQSANVSVKGN